MIYTVLIVEDDPMVASINKRYVEKVPFFEAAATAQTATDALGLTEKHNFDLILIDIHLQNESGIELMKKLRMREYDGDFIMITAEGRENIVQLCARFGAVDYILKPFQFERFQQSLLRYKRQKEWLEDSALVNQDRIDQFYRPKFLEEELDEGNLEKGITKKTMQLILSVIDDLNQEFTIEELTEKTSLSHVSIRKYVRYLEERNILKAKQKYGTVGRPTMYYSKT